jgi:mannose-6-phosphate isomerase-like protein (cupin superfamily)
MKTMSKVRRIVTGFNDEGKSIILMDAEATNHRDHSPGVRTTEIWDTETTPADNARFKDGGNREFTLEPPESGTLFRYAEFAPGEGVDNPFMHTTNTVDYIVIVTGEIYCVMEEGEVLMKAGDSLVQQGTNHAWVNRSDKPCVFAAVMVSANPLHMQDRLAGANLTVGE